MAVIDCERSKHVGNVLNCRITHEHFVHLVGHYKIVYHTMSKPLYIVCVYTIIRGHDTAV